jgi:hypothetical protein
VKEEGGEEGERERDQGTSISNEKNPISTAWRAQSAENARAAMHKCPSFVEMEEDRGEWPVV